MLNPTIVKKITQHLKNFLNENQIYFKHDIYSNKIKIHKFNPKKDKDFKETSDYYLDDYLKSNYSSMEDKFFWDFLHYLHKKEIELVKPFIKHKTPKVIKSDWENVWDGFNNGIIDYLHHKMKREDLIEHITQKKFLISGIDVLTKNLPKIQLTPREEKKLFDTIKELNVFKTEEYQKKIFKITNNFKNPTQYLDYYTYIDNNRKLIEQHKLYSLVITLDQAKINALSKNIHISQEHVIKKAMDFIYKNFKDELGLEYYIYNKPEDNQKHKIYLFSNNEIHKENLISTLIEKTLISQLNLSDITKEEILKDILEFEIETNTNIKKIKI